MPKSPKNYREREEKKISKRSRSRSKTKNRRSKYSRSSSSSSSSPLLSPKRRPNKSKDYKTIEWGKKEEIKNQKNEKNKEKIEIEKPNFNPSGILAKFTNSVNGAILKFTEPIDAKKPNDFWKIFPFKGDESLEAINLKNQSCFLFGKDHRIADVALEHPSISNQQAVIQFRNIAKQDELGNSYHTVIPYLMDLESTNGTYLNGEKIEGAKYYELKHQDIIKFANSSRDYVVMKQK